MRTHTVISVFAVVSLLAAGALLSGTSTSRAVTIHAPFANARPVATRQAGGGCGLARVLRPNLRVPAAAPPAIAAQASTRRCDAAPTVVAS